MGHKIIRLIVSYLIISCFFLNFTYAERESNTTLYRTNEKVQSEIRVEISNIKTEIGHIKEMQEKIYDSTITRLNWEFNVIIIVFGLISIFLGFFGIKIVRKYLDESMKDELSKLTDQKIEKVVNDRINLEWNAKYKALYEKYDRKFADKFKEFSQLVDAKRKS